MTFKMNKNVKGTCESPCSAPLADECSTFFTTAWWNTVAKTQSHKQIRHWSFVRGEWWGDGEMQYGIYVADHDRRVTLYYDDKDTRDTDFLRFVPND